MEGKKKNVFKSKCGAVVIVEAAFVFPIMFIVLFFLIYMGNAFYIKGYVEGIVEEKAIEGANYCADPLLETVKESGVPSLSDLKTKPYSYIFGGMDDIENKIANEIESEIENNAATFFSNMKPHLSISKGNIAKFNNHVIYSTFSVEVKYELKFPINFLGQNTPTIMTINSRAEVPVGDTAEFIRNTDMVIDLFSDTKAGETVKDVFGKVNEFISSFASK